MRILLAVDRRALDGPAFPWPACQRCRRPSNSAIVSDCNATDDVAALVVVVLHVVPAAHTVDTSLAHDVARADSADSVLDAFPAKTQQYQHLMIEQTNERPSLRLIY